MSGIHISWPNLIAEKHLICGVFCKRSSSQFLEKRRRDSGTGTEEQMNYSSKVRTIAITGMLAAVTLVLGLTNIGIIPIPPANVTTMHIPVIIGAILCGPKVGLLLGLVFGLTSVWKAFTATSALLAPLMAVSPILVIIMSVGARLMVPIIARWIYLMIGKKNQTLAAIVAPIAGSLTNTIFYLGLMLLFYVISGIDASGVFAIIAGVGALNGSCEVLAAALICGPIIVAVEKMLRKKAKN